GNGDPGDLHAETAVRGVEADAALPDGDPCLCRQQRTVSAAAGEARRRECAAARQRSAVVAELAPRLWADDPLHLPSLLDHAPRGQRAERSRFVRSLARTSLPTEWRQDHVRG